MSKRITGRKPWLACAAGTALAAAAARLWQRLTAFEGPLALPVPHAPASIALACVLILAAALFALLAARQRLSRRPRVRGQVHLWDRAFLDQSDRVYPALLVSAAFLSVAAVPVMFLEGMERFRRFRELAASGSAPSDNGILLMATAVGALLAFFGLLQMGRDGLRPGARGKGGFSAALPGAAGCVWLMEYFRANASDPVLWDYAPQLLAIVCGMMFYMDSAGMSASGARPRRLLWLAGMTVTLSAASLVSLPGPGHMLLLAAQLLAALGALWRLPTNLANPIDPAFRTEPRQSEQERQEESTHE